MQISPPNLESFSGATAVGALVFVDLALVADAFADNLFPAINIYAQTPTWAIVVAVPLLSLIYLLGILSLGAGEVLLSRLCCPGTFSPEEDSVALISCSEPTISRYQRYWQEGQLLAGSVVAFGLLALGSGLHAWRIAGWRRFLLAVTIFAIVFAASSAALSVRRLRSAHRLALAARDLERRATVRK
jgi:hypothetical protein